MSNASSISSAGDGDDAQWNIYAYGGGNMNAQQQQQYIQQQQQQQQRQQRQQQESMAAGWSRESSPRQKGKAAQKCKCDCFVGLFSFRENVLLALVFFFFSPFSFFSCHFVSCSNM